MGHVAPELALQGSLGVRGQGEAAGPEKSASGLVATLRQWRCGPDSGTYLLGPGL